MISRQSSPNPNRPLSRFLRPSVWQQARTTILQRICTGVESLVSRGAKVRPLINRAAKRWNAKPFRSDPSRRLKLSASRLLTLFYNWKRNGQLPGAFHLGYFKTPPTVPAPVLCRFVDFCAARPRANLKSAWSAFANRPGAFRRGRHAGPRPNFSYPVIRRFFTAAQFNAIQKQLEFRAQAEREIGRLRLQYQFEIRERLPARPRRIRRSAVTMSLDSASL